MQLEMNQKIVLSFDLDFTLINNKLGIINSFNFALKKFKIPELAEFEIEKMIGIPLIEMFGRVSDLNPTELVVAFREYYGEKGIYQSYILPGIKEKLEELRVKKFTLGIITSKKQEMAERIVKFLQISCNFDYILGETEEIKSKTDPKIRNYLDKKYPDFKFIVIGDHPKDAKLSLILKCPFIGVLTGFHSSKSLEEVRKNRIVVINSVKDLSVDTIYSLI
jgi:phosphoglycolate phosphatase